jgi:hypothetical protein
MKNKKKFIIIEMAKTHIYELIKKKEREKQKYILLMIIIL